MSFNFSSFLIGILIVIQIVFVYKVNHRIDVLEDQLLATLNFTIQLVDLLKK